jgi:hypothetical protein
MPLVSAHVNMNPTVAWIARDRATMMPSAVLAWILAVVFCVVGCTGAAAAPATAIFPFEIYDTSGEPPRPDLAERLAMATPRPIGGAGKNRTLFSHRSRTVQCRCRGDVAALPVRGLLPADSAPCRRRVCRCICGSQGLFADIIHGHLDTRRLQRRQRGASRRPDPRRHF